MSIHLQIGFDDITDYVDFYDDPEIKVRYDLESSVPILLSTGFTHRNITTIALNPKSFIIWYRFNTRGMLFGYICNPSGTSIHIPNTGQIYFSQRTFNFEHYQLKVYFDCIDFELYNKNSLPYSFNYLDASDESCISRIENLINLTAIEYKAFKDLTVASYVLLPYTFFNTYKFDFEHTMYNEDGSLKESAIYYPSMIASGGSLKPQYFPQPTKLETA